MACGQQVSLCGSSGHYLVLAGRRADWQVVWQGTGPGQQGRRGLGEVVQQVAQCRVDYLALEK